MKTEANDSAFSKAAFYHPDGGTDSPKESLTKREYFSAMAMIGLLTRVPDRFNNEPDLGVIESDRIASESVIMADKIIKALNETQL